MFGTGFNGPGGASTNSGSAPSGKSVSKSGSGMSPSERNAQGKEGTNSGPGNPSAGRSTSSTSNAGREGQTSGPGNPGAGGGTANKGGRVGGGSTDKGGRVGGTGSIGADSKEGDRSLSMGMDPSRFGGTRSTVGTVGADAREGDRSLSAGIDPSRFGRTPTGMGASPASMDMAQSARASENKSVGMYNAAAALSDANAQRANVGMAARTAENTSMAPYHEALNNFLGITRQAEAGVVDPYNTISGGKKADVENMTIDEAAAYAKQRWSGKTANVLGGYQFKDTTLTGIADDLGIPRDTLMTPEVQSQLAIGLAQRRANQSTVDGKIDKAKFARSMAKEWASFATAATGASFYSKNGIDKAGVSYGDVKAMTDAMVDTGVVGPRRSLSSLGDDPALTASATGSTPSSANRFASTYMGTKDQQKDYFGSVPDHNWPGNNAPGVAGINGPAQVASIDEGDTAPPEDATPQNASVQQEAPAEPPYQRSNTGQVAAAGIDVGAGLIPGIGIGISLINGGLALTGNRTLGEHIVDAIATGEGKYTPGDPGDPSRIENADKETVVASATPKTTSTFSDKYLGFTDTTKRPTPTQKWSDPNAPYTL